MKTKYAKLQIFTATAAALLVVGCNSAPPVAGEAAAPAVAPQSGQAPVAGNEVKTPIAPLVKAAPAPTPVPTPAPVVIEAGTSVRIRTSTAISTKSNSAGDAFHGTLDAPLTVDGKVVIPRGARVEGLVASADPGGRVKGVATISLRLNSIETNKGMVSVSTNTVAREARTTKRNDAVKVGVGSGVGAAIGALTGGGKGAAIGAGAGAAAGTGVVLATRGEPAVVAAESVLTFRLKSPVRVN